MITASDLDPHVTVLLHADVITAVHAGAAITNQVRSVEDYRDVVAHLTYLVFVDARELGRRRGIADADRFVTPRPTNDPLCRLARQIAATAANHDIATSAALTATVPPDDQNTQRRVIAHLGTTLRVLHAQICNRVERGIL